MNANETFEFIAGGKQTAPKKKSSTTTHEIKEIKINKNPNVVELDTHGAHLTHTSVCKKNKTEATTQ